MVCIYLHVAIVAYNSPDTPTRSSTFLQASCFFKIVSVDKQARIVQLWETGDCNNQFILHCFPLFLPFSALFRLFPLFFRLFSTFRIQIGSQLPVAAVVSLLICIKLSLSELLTLMKLMKLTKLTKRRSWRRSLRPLINASLHWKWMAAGHHGRSRRFWCVSLEVYQ